MDKETFYKNLRACQECASLFDHVPRPVFLGFLDAPIMQISQAPSKTVHETGYPFNDASGRKLRHEWYEISDETFYNPENFYITSVGKCFPGKDARGGDNKPPKICAKLWLEGELRYVKNVLYLIVGKAAAEYFFPKRSFYELVMEDQTIRGKTAFVLPHPSPLNVKWFKDHPKFFTERLPKIRQQLHAVLVDEETSR